MFNFSSSMIILQVSKVVQALWQTVRMNLGYLNSRIVKIYEPRTSLAPLYTSPQFDATSGKLDSKNQK